MQVSYVELTTPLDTVSPCMYLKIKLYAGLDIYLPEDSIDNTITLEINGDSNINNIIETINIPGEKAHLVLLNGVYVEPDHRCSPGIFRDGDVLAIWPPVAGG